MSRPLRIEFADAYYHVMNRGAGRKSVFKNSVEKELFLSLLSEAHTQFNIQIHAYCLMTNHYHLLIKTPLANLSRAMRHINGVYTQRYNRLNCTDGPLFRGRYRAILVDSDAYLIHLTKYIHLNPLEAKIVESLNQYRWSSYCAYVGLCSSPKWLFKTEVYGQLNHLSNHIESYKLFMESGEQNEQIRDFYSKKCLAPFLGKDSFKQNLPPLNQSVEIPRAQRLIKRPTINFIVESTASEFSMVIDTILYPKKGRGQKNMARKIVMYIAHKQYNYQLTEIASTLQLKHYGGVASSISYIKQKIKTMPELAIKIDAIIKRLDP